MSCDKWAYEPSRCDGNYCVGDCDFCKLKDKEEMLDEMGWRDGKYEEALEMAIEILEEQEHESNIQDKESV